MLFNAENGDVPRKLLPIIYVLDVSGSMAFDTPNGRPINALNAAMRETMRVLREKNMYNHQAKIKVGVVTYSSGAEWITGGGSRLEELDDLYWDDIAAGGCSDLGCALKLLYDKLSRSGVITDSDTLGYLRPAIVFISGGAPTDDWEAGFKKAMCNKWFANATRVSLAVGDLAKEGTKAWDVLCAISSGGEESVIEVTDLETLGSKLQDVSLSIASPWRGDTLLKWP